MIIKITDQLKYSRLGNQLFELIDSFTVHIDKTAVTVPAGFITDGASVPRAFWWLCAPVAGPFGEAALVHDWMYNIRSNFWDRAFADKCLCEIGRYRGANLIRARAVWLGVRLWGWMYFKKKDSKIF